MNTRVRKAVKKASKLAAMATKKASVLSKNALLISDRTTRAAAVTIAAAQTVKEIVNRQQRKRKMAKVTKAAKQIGVTVAAAAAVTGVALAVHRSGNTHRFR